jgi:hypothetical protein
MANEKDKAESHVENTREQARQARADNEANRSEEVTGNKEVRHIESLEEADARYAEGGVPSDLREVHPEDAHPQPDDGMDSPLVNTDEIRTNDSERGTEHRP